MECSINDFLNPNPNRHHATPSSGQPRPRSRIPVANPVPTSLGARRRHRVLHFDVPIINERVIVSVDSHGLLTAAARSGLDDGPVIFVDIDMDGNFLTDHRVPGEPFESMDRLIRAASAHLLAAPCRDLPQYVTICPSRRLHHRLSICDLAEIELFRGIDQWGLICISKLLFC